MEQTGCDDFICETECDDCGVCRAGVMFHCRGTPVLFLCYKCAPKAYQQIGQQTVACVIAHVLAAA